MGVKSVSVIGATGYLGSGLCLALKQAGFSVRAWGRRRPEAGRAWIETLDGFTCGDVTEAQTLHELVTEASDAIVYCVSLDHHESSRDIDLALATNVQPVWRLLQMLAERSQPVRFLYLSTSQVYGDAVGTITENSPALPRNHYGLTHLMAENILSRYRSEPAISGVSLRLANGYGAPVFAGANCWWLVINDFCRMAVTEKRLQLNSDGLQQRNFVHIDDISRAVELMLRLPAERCTLPAYNVGGLQSISIKVLAHRVAAGYFRMTGEDVPVYLPDGIVSDAAEKTGTGQMLDYGIAAIMRLGFSPKVELDRGITEVLSYVMAGNSP